mmetsp:Transcript_20574/g.18214  ORF Transcript_20574/g.18214 Transcript_20574/m.18214 type:complete len:395 (+) Transcript_20574:2-1186(+)
MGNCQTACCGEGESEIPLDDEITSDYSHKPQKSNKSSKKMDKNELVKKHVGKIIKLQALWRGNMARNQYRHKKLANRGTSRYFTSDEANETIKKGKKYDPEGDRVTKKFSYKTGAAYNGEWKGGFRDGHGVQKWPDKAKYDGSWRDNRAHGKGKFTHVDGDVYDGDWAYDKANGFGVYTHNNGATYEGMWKDDLQHGKGVERWKDGSEYEGSYKKGKKHGFGVYKWADGSQFEGQWAENKISGLGVYSWLDGRQYKGEWRNNNMEGYGFYIWKDGRRYEGQYKDDKKHGYGIYKWADGRKYEGYWTFGKQHGIGRYVVPKENVEKYGLWEDGKRIEWFDEDAVRDINSGDTSWKDHFKKPDSINYIEKSTDFTKPKGFDMKLIEVKERLTKLDK